MFAKLATTAALLAFASPALAVTVISNTPGSPDPGPPPGLTTVVTFDGPSAPGITNTTTGSVFTGSGSVGGQYAAPAGTGSGVYQAVQGGATSTFTFANPLGKFSLYWGSIDTYNTLEFLNAANTVVGSFTGGSFPPAAGNQVLANSNRRITFGFTAAEAVTKVRFKSGSNAFEYDTLAIAGVPEPATWAMMILGFGLIGGAMRSRKAATTKVAYA
jgi:PEP-CTERM motif